MSARSSARELATLALVVSPLVVGLAACGSKGPDGDPKKLSETVDKMLRNIPLPAQLPECKPADLADNLPLTERTAIKIAATLQMPPEAEYSEWTNPSELDYPNAFQLADPNAPESEKRKAAGEIMTSKGVVLYHVDLVDIPIAVEVKELKRGYAGYRAIRYDMKAKPTCVVVFAVKNSKKISEWAMDQVEKAAIVDPAVARAVQDDFRTQLKATVASLGLPRPANMP